MILWTTQDEYIYQMIMKTGGKYSNMSTQTKEKSLLFSRDGVFCKIWRHTEFRTFFSCFYSFPEPRVTMGAERQGIYDSCHPRAAG